MRDAEREDEARVRAVAEAAGVSPETVVSWVEASRRGALPERWTASGGVWRRIGADVLSAAGRVVRRLQRSRLLWNGVVLATGCVAFRAADALGGIAGVDELTMKGVQAVLLGLVAYMARDVRARAATVVALGMAIATGAEFALDQMAGAPAVRGLWPHLQLLAGGVLAAMLLVRRDVPPPVATEYDRALPGRQRDDGPTRPLGMAGAWTPPVASGLAG